MSSLDAEVAEFSVTSRDGTVIGFTSRGRGPGLVLVQGAMGTADDYRELADALAPDLTVHAVDRRGRRMSPRPYTADHVVARDVEDVEAVLEATGSSSVFGLSSGAVVALEAARTSSLVDRVAVYEPPFYRDGISHEGVARIGRAIERGDLPAALVDALLVAGTAPPLLRRAPRRLALLLAAGVLRFDVALAARRAAAGGGPSTALRDLLPGIRYDFADVEGVDGRIETFAAVTCPVLLLSGTRSPAFLRESVRRLAEILPDARHEELAGLGHDGPWNAARGGRPAEVAAVLRTFLR